MNYLRSCLLMLVFGVSVAQACSLPVFRYALENWEADEHVLMLPRGTSDAEIKWWNDFLKNGDFNYEVSKIANDDMPAGLYFPKGFGPWITYDAFKEKGQQNLDSAFVSKQWESASSKKVIDGIIRGDSVIFLFSGGDAKARQAAEEKMRPRIKTLLEYVELADDVVDSWKNFHAPPDEFYSPPRGHVASPIPLGMAISFVHLNEYEALAKQVETIFLAEDLEEQGQENGVRVTVVFGRGRAIPVGHIDDIDKHVIDDVIYFVTGACSCKIKEENPGHDLMLPIYWDDVIWEASATLTGASEKRMVGQMLDPATVKTDQKPDKEIKDEEISEAQQEIVIVPESPVVSVVNSESNPDHTESESRAYVMPLLLALIGVASVLGILIMTRSRG